MTVMCSGPRCVFSSESVTEVRTNIYVTSFGPVSDTDMVSISFLSFLLTLIRIIKPKKAFIPLPVTVWQRCLVWHLDCVSIFASRSL